MEINKLYNEDCLETMARMPDNSIDLVVTSPPYNIGIAYDSYLDKMDWDKYYEWCRDWLSEVYRLLKPDGRFCLIHYLSLGNTDAREGALMSLNHIAIEIGFKHHGLAIWEDRTLIKRTAWGSWLSASAPYINSPYEGILILFKEGWKKDREGKTSISKEEFMESCSGIWRIPTEHNRMHPAPFPEKLAARCIKLLSFEEDIVLDPFVGWGTTAVVAKKLNRKFIGIDISAKYIEMARKRLQQEVLV